MSNKKNPKKQMLRIAHSVAEIEFVNEINRDSMINDIIKKHPEFNSGEFKKMVKDFQEKLHNKGIENE